VISLLNMPFQKIILPSTSCLSKVAVIDGEDWLSPRFRDMLVGDHLGYNVANCRMV
jgi:hypothetical protein